MCMGSSPSVPATPEVQAAPQEQDAAVVDARDEELVAVALLLVVVLRCLPVLRATHQLLIPAVKRCLVSNRSH